MENILNTLLFIGKNRSIGLISARKTGMLSYMTIFGWAVAFFAGDRDNAKFHLNQSLVLHLCFIVCSLFSSEIGSMVVTLLWIIGVLYACVGVEKEVPVLGKIHILN